MDDNESKMTKVSFTLQEISNIKHNITLGRGYCDRMSFGLAYQIWEIDREFGERDNILREIDSLEGLAPPLATKSAEKFKREPLKDLWHKHYTSSRHMNKNVAIRWGADDGKSGNKDLSRMIKKVALEYGQHPDLWQKKLAYDFYVNGFQERADIKRLTGDWIIYGVHQGLNYYLGLSSHEEGRDDPIGLLRRLKAGSSAEFPFLFQ